MQTKNTQNVNLILDRIKSALKIEKDSELAEELNVSPSTTSTWRKRNTLNYDKIFDYCIRHNLSIDWVVLGKGDSAITDGVGHHQLSESSTQNANDILNRVKVVLKTENDVQLARALGVHKNVISNWRLRNSADYGKILLVAAETGVSIDWLLTGEGNQGAVSTQSNNVKGVRIPLIPITAAAGFPAENNYQVSYIEDWYVIPDFKYVDFLIKARGDSMYPKYRSGDVLACRKISNDSFIQWGRTYVVDTPQDTLVKRLYNGGDYHIICKSENERYPDFEISKEDIRSLAIVVGVVRLE